MLRLAEPLRAELEEAAAETDQPLAAFLRQILLTWAAERLAERNRATAA
jgi:hypothetical protein